MEEGRLIGQIWFDGDVPLFLVKLREKHTEWEDQLRERLVEKEDQLREAGRERCTHINSHLNEILSAATAESNSIHQSLDMFILFQLAEMNAQSLVQYKQLAIVGLQEARMEKEGEK